MSLSKFYLACRVGDLDTVQHLLPTLSLNDLNRIEPNGSTALHASVFNGHADVVRLLLAEGAQRRILNRFNLSPSDEAQTLEMKELFDRPATAVTKRFVGDNPQVEWSKAGLHAAYTAFGTWDDPVEFESIETAYEEIINAQELHDAKGMDQIRNFLHQAVEMKDYRYFVRAYTAETDFYKRLNRLHAQTSLNYTEADRNKWFIKFSAVIKGDWHIRNYWWTGMCYRGLSMTNDDLTEYKVGEMITNKTFMSTSKNPQVAVRFASKPEPGMRAVLCIYCVHHLEMALDIHSLSEYPKEEEILIVPNIPFKVIDITQGDTIMMALSA